MLQEDLIIIDVYRILNCNDNRPLLFSVVLFIAILFKIARIPMENEGLAPAGSPIEQQY